MIILLMSIILLVGCQLHKKTDTEGEKSAKSVEPKYMETEDYPDVPAFQDEFTRGFLQSMEETRQGYYPFLSGTEGFELDFPTEGKLGKRSYNIKDKSFEALMIDVGNEESNIVHNITVNYYGHLEEELHKKSRLGQLQSRVGEELDFERIETDSQINYIAKFESDQKEESSENYGYAALVFNNQALGGINIVYESHCLANCEKYREEDEAEIYDWIMSIKFLEESFDSTGNESRMRLLDLDYKYNEDSSKVSVESITQEVEAIYVEETGKYLSLNIL